MKTLIIYDLNGTIIQQITGAYLAPVGLPYIEVDIPNKKYVVSVNVKTKEPIYADIPKTEIELLNEKLVNLETENVTLKQELAITQDAINELILSSMSL